jgi:hypothetical protein
MKETWNLPPATREHLFNLVTNSQYRGQARREDCNFAPPTGRGPSRIERRRGPRERVFKYGWDAHLPCSSQDRQRRGGPDPGRYRLVSLTVQQPGLGDHVTWWEADHVGGNSYAFQKIRIPRCPTCRGAGDAACPHCGGAGWLVMSVENPIAGPCRHCRTGGRRPTQGFVGCPTCLAAGGVIVVDGYAINRNRVAWATRPR